MQDQNTGMMRQITGDEFRHLQLNSPYSPTIAVGDVFKVRGCHFRVSRIEGNGIIAQGISRKEFYEARRQCRL